MESSIVFVRALLDFAGGVNRELPSSSLEWLRSPILWGLWWAVLILIDLTFAGQTSRFIYIDF